MEEVGFVLPAVMALTGGTCLWPAWNGLQWPKLILARPDWFSQHFVTVGYVGSGTTHFQKGTEKKRKQIKFDRK
jgi:hypothetical protein